MPIRLPIMELDSIARGAPDPDLRPVVAAAEKVAHVEDSAIFNGLPAAGIVGIIQASPHTPHKLPPDVTHLPRAILTARETLRQAGVDGPYALVLDAAYTAQVLAAAEDGYPLAKRLTEQVLDGPLVRAPAIEGGVLLSVRGGDYELTVGQDLSIGYAAHDPPDRRALPDRVVHVPRARSRRGGAPGALDASRGAVAMPFDDSAARSSLGMRATRPCAIDAGVDGVAVDQRLAVGQPADLVDEARRRAAHLRDRRVDRQLVVVARRAGGSARAPRRPAASGGASPRTRGSAPPPGAGTRCARSRSSAGSCRSRRTPSDRYRRRSRDSAPPRAAQPGSIMAAHLNRKRAIGARAFFFPLCSGPVNRMRPYGPPTASL